MDDLARRIDAGFADLRAEDRSIRAELKAQDRSIRAELRAQGEANRAELTELRRELRGEIRELSKSMERRFDVILAAILTGVVGLVLNLLFG